MVGMMMNDTVVGGVVVVHWMGHTVISDLRLLMMSLVVVIVAVAAGVQ